MDDSREGDAGDADAREDSDSPVTWLFAAPPKWLVEQAAVYRQSPSTTPAGREGRLVRPVANAIVVKLGLDAPEIRDEVEQEFGHRGV